MAYQRRWAFRLGWATTDIYYLHTYPRLLSCEILKPKNLNLLVSLVWCLFTLSEEADVASAEHCNTCWRSLLPPLLLEHGFPVLSLAACTRKPRAVPSTTSVFSAQNNTVHRTLFASSRVRSVHPAASAVFLLHVCRTHPCSFYNQERIYCFACIV